MALRFWEWQVPVSPFYSSFFATASSGTTTMLLSVEQAIQVLVVDGEYSHIAGVSVSLVVLRETMRRLANDENLSEDEALPCKYFDLIVGSGHGGWIALMLGRLGMTVSRAIEVYESILSRINDENLSPEERADLFETLVKDFIFEVGHSNELRLEDQGSNDSQNHCQTAVLTSSIRNLNTPAVFRTYRVRDNRRSNCLVSEAIRASSSTPGRFSPVKISGQRFASSAHFGHCNPIDYALIEAETLYPKANTQFIMSIGSGNPGHASFGPDTGPSYEETTIRLARDAERKSEEFVRRTSSSILYYRFNVEQGLQAYCTSAEDIKDTVLAHADAYLDRDDVSRRLNDVVIRLRGGSVHPIIIPKETQTTPPPASICTFTTAQPIQAYIHELYGAGHGLPLWDPEPRDGLKPVEIGDVGIMTEDGGFKTLFNATVAAELQIAAGFQLPPSFKPLDICDLDLEVRHEAIYPPYVIHGSIELLREGLEEPKTCTPHSNESDFSLTLKTTRGAALILKDPPTRITLQRSHKILEYIKRHYKAWYHFYEKDPNGPGRILSGIPLVFVTGVHQNSSWALGAWKNENAHSVVTYSGSATHSFGSITSLSGTWNPSFTHNTKQGPRRATMDCPPRLQSHQRISTIFSDRCSAQTLFLRGYIIGRRTHDLEPSRVYPQPPWLKNVLKLISLGIPPVLRAAAEPRDLPPPPPPPTAPAISASYVFEDEESSDLVHEFGFGRLPRHPAEDAIDVILEALPGSELIIIHDDDVAHLVNHSRTLDLDSDLLAKHCMNLFSFCRSGECISFSVPPYQEDIGSPAEPNNANSRYGIEKEKKGYPWASSTYRSGQSLDFLDNSQPLSCRLSVSQPDPSTYESYTSNFPIARNSGIFNPSYYQEFRHPQDVSGQRWGFHLGWPPETSYLDIPLQAGNTESTERCCKNCGTTQTPEWRREPKTGLSLCNACGIYLRTHRQQRPMNLIVDPPSIYEAPEGYNGRYCSYCKAVTTPTWRQHPQTHQLLCNACGMYLRIDGKLPDLSKRRATRRLLSQHKISTNPPEPIHPINSLSQGSRISSAQMVVGSSIPTGSMPSKVIIPASMNEELPWDSRRSEQLNPTGSQVYSSLSTKYIREESLHQSSLALNPGERTDAIDMGSVPQANYYSNNPIEVLSHSISSL
ncbi:hypothetical protein DL96DRAFT_1821936 [Flagelloscypha sp. PMI_526]|nr:hypothetical protein DL96DRAFT_1821936 [Flagelloscypha sp. PMI_526]